MPDIYVLTRTSDVVPVLLQGSVVKLYNATNTVLLAQDITGVDGLASFIGYSAGSYYIRIKPPSTRYEVQGGATQVITVAAVDIRATITVDELTTPVSSDIRLCRCWGSFSNMDGSASSGVSINFYKTEYPAGTIMADDTAVGLLDSGWRLALNSSGYGEIDLPRGAELYAHIPGYYDPPVQIEIPDAASSNLVDILFPYPASIIFYDGVTPITTLAMATSTTKQLIVVVLLRSGVVADPISYFLTLDEATDTLGIAWDSGTTITLTAGAVGSYTILPQAVANDLFFLPKPIISGSLVVTVT